MNKVILLALILPVTAFGQIYENFESGSTGNWVQIPEGRWDADNSFNITGNHSLHHSFDNATAGKDIIAIPLSNFHPDEGVTRWRFKIRHGYDPSTSNNWALFLMCSTDPSSTGGNQDPEGFVVGVNQTGYDDTLRLWKIKGGIWSVVVNSGINWQTDIGSSVAVEIVAERSLSGQWSLTITRLTGEQIGASTGIDPELLNPGWLIITYKYSATRDRLLWIDDIAVEGTFYEDHSPPLLTGCEIVNRNTLMLSFNEPLSEETLTPANFSLLNADNFATEITPLSSFSFNIEFNDDFPNRSSNKLVISQLCDRNKNCIQGMTVEFTPGWPGPGDIIITEIMPDPIPAVSLPEREFVEIKNRTDQVLFLKGWSLLLSDESIPIPDIHLEPDEYRILTSEKDTALFLKYGKVTGLKSFPPLTDRGMIVAIISNAGEFIHGIEYSSAWYGSELKEEGGWSLEMVDFNYPFHYENNWKASVSGSGGTPGTINSISRENEDNRFGGIFNVYPEDSMNIRIRFSEPVFGISRCSSGIKVNGEEITSICVIDPLMREYLVVPSGFIRQGKIYTLNIPVDLKDFAGNRADASSFDFGIAERAEHGDILFNELLFNPLHGDPDFIEFYNTSEKVIDASRLLLFSLNITTSDTSSAFQVSGEQRCILPGSYYAITTDREKTLLRYSFSCPDNIHETGNFPSMPDDKGHLLLMNRELDMIDEVRYDEKMHYSLLSGNEGISLEKLSPESSSLEKTSWHSASESSGWGTPGAPNSIITEMPVTNDQIIFSSTRISPDNDGFEDILVIDIILTGSGNVVTVEVFDDTGILVNKLANNLFSGQVSSVIWNGTESDGDLVNTGIYIILVSVFNDSGKTFHFKRVCTVLRPI